MKPYLFIDVDGVLHLYHSDKNSIFVKAVNTTISPPAGARENFTILSERFKIIWASSWNDDANLAFRELLDLKEDLEVLRWGENKLDSIINMVGTSEFVFMDDEAQYELENSKVTLGDNQHVLNIDYRYGLTLTDVATALGLITK